jgi:ADP-ribosylglycohydrolase
MRVAPLGAYFADDIPMLIEQARLSAEVTHAHPEGQAGAIAVALAAAFAWNHRGKHTPRLIREFMEFVHAHTPDSQTAAGIAQAMDLPRSYTVDTAVSVLGNGVQVSAPDTVPFTIWCAARHFGRYTDAMWTTVSGGGDRDTACAIVGGVVILSASDNAIPPNWLSAREAVPLSVHES